jgi:hypothetical protein
MNWAKYSTECLAKRVVTPETPPDEAQAVFQARRLRIAERCRQIQVDCESWNDQHPQETPITVDLDFVGDLLL